jgi:hypothetical protein
MSRMGLAGVTLTPICGERDAGTRGTVFRRARLAGDALCHFTAAGGSTTHGTLLLLFSPKPRRYEVFTLALTIGWAHNKVKEST